MKKRAFAFILAALMALTAIVVPVGAEEISRNWGYTISNGEVTINRYYGSATSVTIPSTIGGYPVTALSSWENKVWEGSTYNIYICGIFYGCPTTRVTIPDSIMSIGNSAFRDCRSLTSVTIPNSVTTIGNTAFLGCANLTSVSIPDSVTTIGNTAFSGCANLTSVSIPDSVTTIGSSVFSGCTSLRNVTIGNGVTMIRNSTFIACTSLTSVTIPDSVMSIGNYAFNKCSKLATVYYTGSQAQWNSISIGSNNDPLLNANIVFAHNYTAVVTPPTCTAGGYTTYTCTNCGDSYTADETPALGHNYIATVTPPTCTSGGVTTYVCSHCGDSYTADELPALGHSFENGVCKTCGAINYGDANNDGVVNSKDIILIRKYIANYDEESETSSVEVSFCADANANGEITSKDVTLLRRYLASYDESTGTSTVPLGPQS